MDSLMSLTAIEAQIDRHNAIAHARANPEPDTRPKFHVAYFRSRAKAVAMREWGYAHGFFFSIAKRGAVYHDGKYSKKEIEKARKDFFAWWRRTHETRIQRVAALQTRIDQLPMCFVKSLETIDAQGHLDNAKAWTRKSTYDWRDAVEEAEVLVMYMEGK